MVLKKNRYWKVHDNYDFYVVSCTNPVSDGSKICLSQWNSTIPNGHLG